MKIISKAKVKEIFSRNNEEYSELKILRELTCDKCPHILQLIESFEDSEVYYAVTEYMPIGDLLKYAQEQAQQPLDEELVKFIIKQVAQGVKALHSRLIIHRDIKCENILMSDYSRNATVRIADLGSAIKLRSPHDTASFMIGTPGYIAPEVLIGKNYGLAYDIWSMGALMHMLLSFELPYYSKDSKELLRRLLTEDLNLNANESLGQLS